MSVEAASNVAADSIEQSFAIAVGLQENWDLSRTALSGSLGAVNGMIKVAMLRTCFAAGTKLGVPEGLKRIDQFRDDDLVAARNELDPNGPVEFKRVKRVFQRLAPIVEFVVEGRTIETTLEHPFHAERLGWLPVGSIEPGNLLVTLEGRSVRVDAIRVTGRMATVYNLEIEDHHTYFVSGDDWGFAVWAHNASYSATPTTAGHQKHHIGQDAALNGSLPGYNYYRAPVTPLRGGSHVIGSDHYLANLEQNQINAALRATGATDQSILQVTRTAREALKAAGKDRTERKQLLTEFVDYLRTLPGVGGSTRVPIPG